jgi:hypothetical protein
MPEELLRWFRDDGLPLPPLLRELAGLLEEEKEDESMFQAVAGPGKSLRAEADLKAWRPRTSSPCARIFSTTATGGVSRVSRTFRPVRFHAGNGNGWRA